jgi:UDP-sugar diphosphatase
VEKDHPVHKVRTFRGAVGLMGSLHTIFYCEVNKAMKVGPGGGNANEGEIIELFELPKDKIREFIDDESSPKPPGLLFALLWFLNERERVLSK